MKRFPQCGISQEVLALELCSGNAMTCFVKLSLSFSFKIARVTLGRVSKASLSQLSDKLTTIQISAFPLITVKVQLRLLCQISLLI